MDSFQGGRPENQDYALGEILEEGHLIVTVCDGMGGSAGGRTASFMAATEIIDSFKEQFVNRKAHSDIGYEEMIKNSICSANKKINVRSKSDNDLLGMGTTTVVLLLTPKEAYVAHVGDSRCYQLRDKEKVFRTFDHSRVFGFVKEGYMTEEQARTANGSNIITKALGTKSTVEPEICKITYKENDRFILCSDGIWNTMPEPKLIVELTKYSSTSKCVEKVCSRVVELGDSSEKEYDNLTLMVVDTKQDSTSQPSLLSKLWEKGKKYFQKARKANKKTYSLTTS